MPPKVPTLQNIWHELLALRQEVLNTPRLHLKDLCRRYGWSERTVYRMLRRGKLPRPIRFSGSIWRLEDLQKAEMSGQLPPPASG